MTNENGKTTWIFPDLEMPPEGDFPLIGHESVIILNTNKEAAHLRMTLYFADRDPIENLPCVVQGQRVRCLRTYNPDDFGGVVIPREVQYALRIESDLPVVVQYGRLDTRHRNGCRQLHPLLRGGKARRTEAAFHVRRKRGARHLLLHRRSGAQKPGNRAYGCKQHKRGRLSFSLS